MTKGEKANRIIKGLKKLFPKTRTALNYGTNWELLVSIILSAQATDKKVNEVTPFLFEKYKTIKDYANANLGDFEKDISSIGLFRMKAKNIIAAANMVEEKYKGKVPDNMVDLVVLPGVGRKTANVLMSQAFNKTEGIAVDTHVKRLSQLWGLTKNNNPIKIEKDLIEIVPRSEWIKFNFRVVDYGRKYCPAHCKHIECPLREFVI